MSEVNGKVKTQIIRKIKIKIKMIKLMEEIQLLIIQLYLLLEK
jgi:hypothetical protein